MQLIVRSKREKLRKLKSDRPLVSNLEVGMVYENHVISDHTLKITDVIPVTIRAVRNYPAWVIVKIQTAQGVEGIAVVLSTKIFLKFYKK